MNECRNFRARFCCDGVVDCTVAMAMLWQIMCRCSRRGQRISLPLPHPTKILKPLELKLFFRFRNNDDDVVMNFTPGQMLRQDVSAQSINDVTYFKIYLCLYTSTYVVSMVLCHETHPVNKL
jgi:hypothetical protein